MKITKIAQATQLYEIRNRITNYVIYSATTISLRECVEEAVRSEVSLSEADLYGTNLTGANLSGANLSRANLSGANLTSAILSLADLTRANLIGTNLTYVSLYGANLTGANLTSAILSRADLTRADLIGTNLTGVNLSRANLSHADLTSATNVNLDGALNTNTIIREERPTQPTPKTEKTKPKEPEKPKPPEDIPVKDEEIPPENREVLELLGKNKNVIKTSKNAPVQQNLPLTNFPVWLHQQIIEHTDNFKKPFLLDQEQISLLTKWVQEVKPDLTNMEILNAYAQAHMWSQQQLAKQYKNNKAIFKWKDGFKIVEVPLPSFSSQTPPEEHNTDLEIERELMQVDDGEYRHIYGQSYNYLDNKKLPTEGNGLIIYSLRDPQNMPKATIELGYDIRFPKSLYVHEVFTNEELDDHEDLHARRDYIKEFFNYLKSQGYQFGTVGNDSSEDIKATDLDDVEWEDQFGMPYSLWGVGGSEDNYFDGLQEAYQAGGDGSYWSFSSAKKVVDNLIAYAEQRNELNLLESALEGYSGKGRDKNGNIIKQFKGFNDLAFNWWMQTEDSIQWQHENPEEPSKEDFMIPPDVIPGQKEMEGMPPAQPRFDKVAYEQAMKDYEVALKEHEEERSSYEEEFEPYKFQNYVYEELQKAKARQEPQKSKKKTKASNMKTIKTADKIDEKLPSGEQMALYVLTLKQYLIDNPNISEEWKDLIKKLPAPRQIRQDFSIQELKLLYETVEYLWKLITGQKIINDEEIIKAPESLKGNYIMIANGILLEGVNTHDIIRHNSSLLCSLLNIGGMTMEEKLTGNPQELVKFIIKSGALRLFITRDKRFYSQCSPDTYSKWAKKKIQKLDFKKKVVKLIDLRAEYKGWSSGISIILP